MSYPHSNAILWNGREFTWDLVDDYVHSTARRLKEIGVKPGYRVLLEAAPAPGMIIVFLALLHIGAIACPFDPRLTASMFDSIKQKIAPFILLAFTLPDQRFTGLRTFKIDDVICLEPVERFMSASATGDFKELPPERAATIIFSSGSTGDHKAVLHTFSAHWHNARGSAEAIPFGPGDRWLMSLPLYRISGIAVIFRALFGKGTIILPDRNAPDLAQSIISNQPTHISLVPTQFLRLLEVLPQTAWGSFKAILIGGAPVPALLIERAVQMALPVFLTYGMTETASQIATSPLNEACEQGARLLPYREACIIANEICVRGPVTFSGYVEGEKITNAFDANGWFHTGDRGVLNRPFLKVSGRRDRMFISGGENIYPEIIEKALLSYPAIIAARVEPKADPRLGQVPKAFIRLGTGHVFNESDLRTMLKEHLLPFQIPKEFDLDPGYRFPDK
ncbi:MAG: AMP-binding protein [Candidatus Omnitrophica bacterium]|nr:AMP-binding protein [Candidatus Omnitrophota bacterium]